MASRSVVEIILRARGGAQVKGELSGVSRGVIGLESASRRTGRALLGVGAAAASAGTALGYGLYRGVRSSLEAFAESEKVGAQTTAVLKSTGMQAGVTRRQIEDYAASLMQMSGVDDEAIQSAENMLLTFRDIRGKAFEPAIRGALDMSAAFTAMGKDMSVQDAALQLGKALNDPARGMSRLQRIGVTFSEQQIDQAKALQESGNRLGAQRIILRELAKEFGGAARKQGDTFTGTMNKLANASENAQEVIGLGFAPAVDFAAKRLTSFIDGAQPDLMRLSKGLDDTFGRKDIDMAGKLAIASRQVRQAGKPYVEQLVQGLKDAHLDQRLEQAVEWAIPKIADGFATAAPRAAKAFVNAWMNSGPWGKLATAIFVAYKARGLIGGLAKAGGGLAGGTGGAGGLAGAGRGLTPANPVFVADVTGRGPGATPGAGRTPRGGRLARGAGAAATAGGVGLAIAGGTYGISELSRLNDEAARRGGILGALGKISNVGESVARKVPLAGDAMGLADALWGRQVKARGTIDATTAAAMASFINANRVPTVMRPLKLEATQPLIVKLDGRTLAEAMAKVHVQTRDRDRHGG